MHQYYKVQLGLTQNYMASLKRTMFHSSLSIAIGQVYSCSYEYYTHSSNYIGKSSTQPSYYRNNHLLIMRKTYIGIKVYKSKTLDYFENICYFNLPFLTMAIFYTQQINKQDDFNQCISQYNLDIIPLHPSISHPLCSQ